MKMLSKLKGLFNKNKEVIENEEYNVKPNEETSVKSDDFYEKIMGEKRKEVDLGKIIGEEIIVSEKKPGILKVTVDDMPKIIEKVKSVKMSPQFFENVKVKTKTIGVKIDAEKGTSLNVKKAPYLNLYAKYVDDIIAQKAKEAKISTEECKEINLEKMKILESYIRSYSKGDIFSMSNVHRLDNLLVDNYKKVSLNDIKHIKERPFIDKCDEVLFNNINFIEREPSLNHCKEIIFSDIKQIEGVDLRGTTETVKIKDIPENLEKVLKEYSNYEYLKMGDIINKLKYIQ